MTPRIGEDHAASEPTVTDSTGWILAREAHSHAAALAASLWTKAVDSAPSSDSAADMFFFDPMPLARHECLSRRADASFPQVMAWPWALTLNQALEALELKVQARSARSNILEPLKPGSSPSLHLRNPSNIFSSTFNACSPPEAPV